MARAVPILFATLVLLIALVAAPLAAEAQPAGKVYRIGILSTLAVADISGADPAHPHIRALVQRLGELGWMYGKSLVTEPRGADGKLERFPALAEEWVRAGVDVIVTTGGNPRPPRRSASRSRRRCWRGLMS